MDKKTWSVEIVPINGPDGLRETTRGSDVEIVQLKPGKLLGSIKHFGIGNLGISLGRFDSAIRMRGALHQERIVLGTIIDSAGRVTQWWKDVHPGDLGVFPALVEFDAIHDGGAAYLLVSIALPELLATVAGEEHLADPAFWNTKRVYHTDSFMGTKMLRRLMGIISGVEHRSTASSDRAADFLQRSIVESFVLALMNALDVGKGALRYRRPHGRPPRQRNRGLHRCLRQRAGSHFRTVLGIESIATKSSSGLYRYIGHWPCRLSAS